MSKLLKIGDLVFYRNYGDVFIYGYIDRVTNKFAFVKNSKFKIEYEDKSIDICPREKWSTTYYFIPDDKDIIDFRKKAKTRFVFKYDLSKLSYDKICEIYDIIIRDN